MLVLFVLGSRLERVTGKVRFLIIYLLGGLAGNILSMLMELNSREYAVSAGASGAVFAVMGAMIYVVVRNRGWLYFLCTLGLPAAEWIMPRISEE